MRKTTPAKKKTTVKTPKKRKALPSGGDGLMLTQTESVFINEFIKEKNAARAYKVAADKASMKSSVARAAGSRMLSRVNVKAAIAKKLSAANIQRYISAEFVINNLGRLAEGNIGNFVAVNDDGTVRADFTGITKEDMYQLTELSMEEVYEPGAELGAPPTIIRKIKFKVADRRAVSDTLARLGNLYERSKRDVAEHVYGILLRLKDNLITAREAAFEFHMIGHPLPEALKIELLKAELAPPPGDEGITDDELDRRYKAAMAATVEQRTLFLPDRKALVKEIKENLKDSDAFREGEE